jgi:hypothetical protein
MIRPEISQTIINDRVRVLRTEAKNSRRARIAKALKR